LGIGYLKLYNGEYAEATRALEQASEIADDISDMQLQAAARREAARANLYAGDLLAAHRLIEGACQYSYPLEDAVTATLLGVVAHRQGDSATARRAFTDGIDRSDALLAMTPHFFAALDSKAVALCGLALGGQTENLPAARNAFRAAREITSAPGIVQGILQLFDALALADKDGILTDLRPIAAGTASA